MRTTLRSAALVAIAGALTAGGITPAVAEPRGARVASWSADLAAGEASGVRVEDHTAVLDPAGSFLAPVADGATTEGGTAVPTGLLTLPAHDLDAVSDRVTATLDADTPSGSTATVDVRGRRANGGWSEWIPAAPGTPVTLPEPTSVVQSRLVLTGTSAATPAVRAMTLTAQPTERTRLGRDLTEQAPLSYRVFATREGLAGGTTANGHVIAERDHFVALPSRRALSPRGTSDYSVKVCAPTGRCAFAPVWDVGPWNTRDDYWNPGNERQEWADLPQGVPQAQAAHTDGYNGGRDQYDRKVANPAGIDLGDGLFWDALGLEDNAYVTVDYLWTGNVRLSTVLGDEPLDVLAAPDAASEVVGLIARRAAVPVDCALSTGAGTWLRIGAGQYVDARAVPQPGPVGACAAEDPGAPAPAEAAAVDDGARDGDTAAGDVPIAGPDARADRTAPGVTAAG